jgi:hypothetical protein
MQLGRLPLLSEVSDAWTSFIRSNCKKCHGMVYLEILVLELVVRMSEQFFTPIVVKYFCAHGVY